MKGLQLYTVSVCLHPYLLILLSYTLPYEGAEDMYYVLG